MTKTKTSKIGMSAQIKEFGKSDIGITQLLKDTGRDYFKLNKLKKVM